MMHGAIESLLLSVTYTSVYSVMMYTNDEAEDIGLMTEV